MLDYWISLKFDDQKNKQLVQDELTELLRRRRKVAERKAGQLCDLRDGFADAAVGSDHVWAVPADVLAVAVGLLVGGVGVMNIMLVSVTERTREIGVRKAIGATKQTILTQFTLEAMTLCAVGG